MALNKESRIMMRTGWRKTLHNEEEEEEEAPCFPVVWTMPR